MWYLFIFIYSEYSEIDFRYSKIKYITLYKTSFHLSQDSLFFYPLKSSTHNSLKSHVTYKLRFDITHFAN